MVEVALQLLIGQVDAELLKTVMLVIFESKDVEYSDVELVEGGKGLKVTIEPRHNPLKHASIESLG